jgi:DNA polymerase-3 subunit delta
LKLSPDNLASDLASRLLPVYVVSGDDPLLTAEAADAIRAAPVRRVTVSEVLPAERRFELTTYCAAPRRCRRQPSRH